MQQDTKSATNTGKKWTKERKAPPIQIDTVVHRDTQWNHAQEESFRDALAKVLDCDFVVSEFELQSRYYFHFWINTFGKGMDLVITPVMG